MLAQFHIIMYTSGLREARSRSYSVLNVVKQVMHLPATEEEVSGVH